MKTHKIASLILALLMLISPVMSSCDKGGEDTADAGSAETPSEQNTTDKTTENGTSGGTTGFSGDTTGTVAPWTTEGFSDTVTNAQGVTGALTSAITTVPVTTTSPVTTSPTTTTAPVAVNKTVDMYDVAKYDAKTPVPLSAGSYFGQHFSINAKFDSLSAWCPSWSNSIGNMSMTLYRFDTSIANSKSGTPIATKLFENYADCTWITLPFDVQEPGDYVIIFADATEQVGIWLYPTNISGSVFSDNGVEKQGEVCMTVRIRTEANPLFNKCKSDTDLSTTVTTPPEPTIPEGDILNVRDAMPDTWAATDGLGRVLPTNAETGNLQADKVVGMFYWTWHSSHSKTTAPHNIQNVCDTTPEAITNKNSSVWKGVAYGTPCHWNEPVYGYYTTTDKWVLRKQAEMLANAGVDVVIFDNTNGTFTWKDSYLALLEVWSQARRDGVKTPKISFIMPFWDDASTVIQLREIYQTIYRTDMYREMWFYWQGKPLMMARPNGLNRSDKLESEIYNFFTFRPGVPEYNGKSKTNTNLWGWLAIYPQATYRDPSGKVQMTVGVAQNWGKDVGLTAMNGKQVFGRTYTSNGYDTQTNAKLYGANFAQQWEYALSKDPDFIFVTGWNEWVAGRHDYWPYSGNGGRTAATVDNAFPDQFNDEYSRDIEPSTGDLKDHYYYQLVSYIRKFKGTRAVPAPSAVKTIDITGNISQWNSVSPYYVAYQNNVSDRDSDGYLTTHYKNTTGRNDIVGAKVARDGEYLYFMVECASNISPYTDEKWMRLFIDTGSQGKNWEGFEFVLNRNSPTASRATLEKSNGGWSFTSVGQVDYKVTGKYLVVRIPKAYLGITSDKFTVNFKWNDNMQKDGDIMDFYTNGDTAPGGRFMFSYAVK